MPATSQADPVEYRYRYDWGAVPDWQPLERFCQICRDHSRRAQLQGGPGLPDLDPNDFIYMGRAVHPTRPPILLYKHIHTWRYLRLDPAGHAYAAKPVPARGAGTYRVIRHLPSAVVRVLNLPMAARVLADSETRPQDRCGVATGPPPQRSAAVVTDPTPPEIASNDNRDGLRTALQRVDGAAGGGIEGRRL